MLCEQRYAQQLYAMRSYAQHEMTMLLQVWLRGCIGCARFVMCVIQLKGLQQAGKAGCIHLLARHADKLLDLMYLDTIPAEIGQMKNRNQRTAANLTHTKDTRLFWALG